MITLTHLRQLVQKKLPVVVAEVDILLSIAASCNVIERAGILDAEGSCHRISLFQIEVEITPQDYGMSNVRPDPNYR